MDADNLTIDDRFHLLLHKKIMNKRGSTMRRAKKYYNSNIKFLKFNFINTIFSKS